MWTKCFAIAVIFPAIVAAKPCQTIDNDDARLACYDNRQRTPQTEATSTPIPPEAEWLVKESASTMTDEPKITAFLEAKKVEGKCHAGVDTLVAIGVKCTENVTQFILYASNCVFTATGDSTKVDARFDGGPLETIQFKASSNHKMIGYFTGKWSIPLVKRLLDASALALRFRAYSSPPITATFDLRGASEGIKRIREACLW